MLHLNRLALGLKPRIAVSFLGQTPLLDIFKAARSGVDIAELRIDLFRNQTLESIITEAKKFSGLPTIATIRSHAEGGKWRASEQARLSLFKGILPYVSAIDIELSSKRILKETIHLAKNHRKTAIVSYHNFKQTPSNEALLKIARKARLAGADIIKIAVFANQIHDLNRMADFTKRYRHWNLVTICMGSAGQRSRIEFPRLGSLFTFAAFHKASAPGQLDLKTTVRLLKG